MFLKQILTSLEQVVTQITQIRNQVRNYAEVKNSPFVPLLFLCIFTLVDSGQHIDAVVQPHVTYTLYFFALKKIHFKVTVREKIQQNIFRMKCQRIRLKLSY